MKSKKVLKIGGSLYVAIDPYIAKELGIKEGSELDEKLKGKQIIITKVKEEKQNK
jgi:antitoxin component of MazEF toxin-antitoxin module